MLPPSHPPSSESGILGQKKSYQKCDRMNFLGAIHPNRTVIWSNLLKYHWY